MSSEHALSEMEIRILISAMEADLDAKAELAELELRYEQEKSEIMSRVKATHAARHNAFRSVVTAHGLDPDQWCANVGDERIVPILEVTTGTAHGRVQQMPEPPLSRDEMEQRRAGAVRIRTREES